MGEARAYYNEFDPFAAQWLRNLIDAGLIPPGDVDERSIVDVQSADLAGYAQCHFFAGIGGWPHALRLTGWPDDRPVWTGSCPCQPLSGAGLRKGHADERHLWPAFHDLIAERQPATVFGEQVASKDGREWFAAVRADLEKLGYAVGGADLCAAGVGAPHIRQRLFWVADTDSRQRDRIAGGQGRQPDRQAARWDQSDGQPERGCPDCRLANAHGGDACTEGVQRGGERGQQPEDGGIGRVEHADRQGRDAGQPAAEADGHRGAAGPDGGAERVGDAASARLEIQHRQPGDDGQQQPTAERTGQAVGGLADMPGERRERGAGAAGEAGRRSPEDGGDLGGRPGAHHGGWNDADWLYCTDGKWRPVEPVTFPLAHGFPGRVGLLRGYGNAINPVLAAQFIQAFSETLTTE